MVTTGVVTHTNEDRQVFETEPAYNSYDTIDADCRHFKARRGSSLGPGGYGGVVLHAA